MKLAALFYLSVTHTKIGLLSFPAKFGLGREGACVKTSKWAMTRSLSAQTGLQGMEGHQGRVRWERTQHRAVPREAGSAIGRATVNNPFDFSPDSQDDRLSLCSNVKTRSKLLRGQQATEGGRQSSKFSLVCRWPMTALHPVHTNPTRPESPAQKRTPFRCPSAQECA